MIPVYYEAAAVITVLVLLGQVLELRARERTGSAIRALLNLAPKTARRLRADGQDEEIPLEQVQVGDRLRVRPGDAVPVDGTVLEGKSAVDESMVTGESMPVEKEAGAKLIGGTINGTGALVMRAEKVGADTLLSRIVHMVAEAQRSRAPIQRLADAVSAWFVPAVIAVAVVAFVAWMIWGRPRLRLRARRGRLGPDHRLSLCAGAGDADVDHGGHRQGRHGRHPDQECRSPGALREGRHAGRRQDRHLDRRQAARRRGGAGRGFDETTVLSLGASLERSSEHPLAAAIVASARERGLAMQEVADFASITGKGVTGKVGGRQVAVGNSKLSGTFASPAPTSRREPRSCAVTARRLCSCRRGPSGGHHRGRRSDQGDDTGGACRACGRMASASSC